MRLLVMSAPRTSDGCVMTNLIVIVWQFIKVDNVKGDSATQRGSGPRCTSVLSVSRVTGAVMECDIIIISVT